MCVCICMCVCVSVCVYMSFIVGYLKLFCEL